MKDHFPMLGVLTEKMQGLLSKVAGKKKLTEENIAEAVSEVRLALLEADVNYGVAKTLVKRVKESARRRADQVGYARAAVHQDCP